MTIYHTDWQKSVKRIIMHTAILFYLSMQRVLGGELILQFVVEVVNVRRLPLSSQVAFL